MTFDEPMSWSTVAAAFDALVTYRGPDLLRMKGILNVKDTDKPVVIHGVQHVFHPPATLDAWPEGDDRKSRVVFITRDIAESTIRKVFASFFEAEKKGWSGQVDPQQQQQ
jgi:G3E family GTPase